MLINLGFVEDNKLMRFSQEYKTQNMLKININIYLDIRAPKVPKFWHRGPNEEVENISKKLAQDKSIKKIKWKFHQ